MKSISVTAFILAATASVASAEFVFQQGFVVSTDLAPAIHGLASDGDQFFLGSFEAGISVRDSSFNEVSLLPNPGPFGNIRGVAYDSTSGTLLAGNNSNGDIYRVSTDGTLLGTMDVMGNSQLNAVGVDGNSGDFFVAGFNGNIQRHSSSGDMLFSFMIGTTLTGLAVDDVNESIFLMSSQTDTVFEYNYDGVLIDTVILDATPTPSVNGQGLFYNNTTGQLYVTGQFGKISIYGDSTRPVVPAPGALALLGFSGCAAARRRRS